MLALVLLGSSLAGVLNAAAGVTSGGSVTVRPPTIFYRQPKPNATNVAGRLSSGQSGVRVTLELRRWPFHGPFTPATSERTANGGRFNFVQRPSRATQYRVATATSATAAQTVYLYPGYDNASCTWSGGQGRGSCSRPPKAPGSYTLHFTFDYLYPAAAFATESRLKVFVYFGECFRCSVAPAMVRLQRKVSQSPNRSNGDAHVSISQTLTVRVGQSYRWYLAPCLQTTERTNGFGLPGAPGSHRCGRPSVPSRYFLHGRELG